MRSKLDLLFLCLPVPFNLFPIPSSLNCYKVRGKRGFIWFIILNSLCIGNSKTLVFIKRKDLGECYLNYFRAI
jgi:hypothetical protein